MRVLRKERGQATVELVAILPVVLSIAFGVFWVLSAAASGEIASNAAQAGAMALLQDKEPVKAAKNALPKGFRKRARVRVKGRKVTVSVPPQRAVPGLENVDPFFGRVCRIETHEHD